MLDVDVDGLNPLLPQISPSPGGGCVGEYAKSLAPELECMLYESMTDTLGSFIPPSDAGAVPGRKSPASPAPPWLS